MILHSKCKVRMRETPCRQQDDNIWLCRVLLCDGECDYTVSQAVFSLFGALAKSDFSNPRMSHFTNGQKRLCVFVYVCVLPAECDE